MGLERDDNPPPGPGKANCPLCNSPIKSEEESYKTPYKHTFHKNCIRTHFAANPITKVLPKTPGQMGENVLSTAYRETPGCSNASQASANKATIQGQQQVMQNNILSALAEKLNHLIETNVENCLRRFNSAPASHNSNPDNRMRQPDAETWQGNHSNNSSFERNSGSLSSELSRRPDRVGPIMNGWKLKFSGTGLSVDNYTRYS